MRYNIQFLKTQHLSSSGQQLLDSLFSILDHFTTKTVMYMYKWYCRGFLKLELLKTQLKDNCSIDKTIFIGTVSPRAPFRSLFDKIPQKTLQLRNCQELNTDAPDIKGTYVCISKSLNY